MRWSIRNQILIPLIAIQGAAVAAITTTAAALAAKRSEGEIVGRLNNVIETLGHANFPYTSGVLAKMRGLSGAHFVAFAADGRVVGKSLSDPIGPPETSRPAGPKAQLERLGDSPTVRLGGTRYFAVPVRSATDPGGAWLLVLYPETSWRRARREAAMPPLMLGIGALGLMAAVTSWIAHRIGGRIRRVEHQVARIARGVFEELDVGDGRDEVQDLARSINRMCAQLREMRRTIRQSERTGLLAQLAAGLAHQLRNSLTGARMSVQLHARRSPPPEGDRTLEVALRQLAMTEEQVKGLLSLGRVEPRRPTTFDPARLLTDVAVLVHPTCQHAKVMLGCPPGDASLRLTADEGGVRAAVLNLALNGIEASGPGGRVTLSARDDDGHVTIEVSDTGPGPPPELARNLFEPFVTGKAEGVGLGLAIASQVAAEHGGRLSWERSGGETCFRLRLPSAGDVAEGVA